MISLKERKLALLIQTEQLKKQLDSLRQQGPEALQLSTYTGLQGIRRTHGFGRKL